MKSLKLILTLASIVSYKLADSLLKLLAESNGFIPNFPKRWKFMKDIISITVEGDSGH